MSSSAVSNSGEPIDAVLARLAPVDVEALSVVGCDRWLADATRVVGWLTVMRLDVEQARSRLVWCGAGPGGGHGADGADGAARGGSVVDGRDPEPVSMNDDDGAGSRDGDAELEPEREPVRPSRRSSRAAARDARVNRCLVLLPSFRALLEAGELTVEHVLALDAIRNRHVARQHEATILAAALERTAEDFAGWLRIWDAEIDLGLGVDVAARQRRLRSVRLFDGPHQMGEVRATLPPALFDSLRRTLLVIDAELQRQPGRDHTATWDQRMADAFEELLHRANTGAGGRVGAGGSLRTAVVVLIDLDDLLSGTGHGTSIDGTPIGIGEIRRMAATGHVIPAVLGAGSVPLDVGRAQRYANDEQWLALMLCDAPLGTLDAHHSPDWGHGGTTDLSRMCILCTRCHRRVHTQQIQIEITNGQVHATDRTGTPIPTHNRTSRHQPTRTPTGRESGTTDTPRAGPSASTPEHHPAA